MRLLRAAAPGGRQRAQGLCERAFARGGQEAVTSEALPPRRAALSLMSLDASTIIASRRTSQAFSSSRSSTAEALSVSAVRASTSWHSRADT